MGGPWKVSNFSSVGDREQAMYDVVVIGGGSGGLGVAAAAVRVGAKVALIEKHRIGGEGSLGACLPSKGLAQTAKLIHQVKSAAQRGLGSQPHPVDFAGVMSQVRAVVGDLAARDSASLLGEKGIDVFHGSASFAAYDTVKLDDGQTIAGHRFVIATGSRPAIPDIPGLAEAGYLDSHSFWSLEKLPASVIVLGNDPTGIEFAQALARMGSTVTVLTDSARILLQEEPEASQLAARILTAEGVTIGTGVVVDKVEIRGDKKVCRFRDPATGGAGEAVADVILVAAGRLANVESLNLDSVGVHADAQHGITVDDHLQTQAPRIYAIGDVLLRHQYTHVAEHEAAVAFQNAVLRIRKRVDYASMPRATFTDPEVASVGIGEQQARAEQRPHRVYTVSYSDIARARIDGRTDGFAKVVATPAGKVLGATVVGEDASMIIHELSLAIAKNLSLGDLAAAVPIYPTYAEVIDRLAKQQRATKLETGYVQAALKLFYGFVPRIAAANGSAPPESAAEEPHAAQAHGH
jgi:pyruvate/2-oxoglutarate dehydrogenase complex dihydrolipoamide dehydrogenase (E3) component